MNSFDESLSGDRQERRIELQDRLLQDLSQPLYTPPRVRKSLSKFTLTRDPPRDPPVPAYRTKGKESLSPPELKSLSSSPYTRNQLGNERRKGFPLQKKTIHRSLEDLRKTRGLSPAVSKASSKAISDGRIQPYGNHQSSDDDNTSDTEEFSSASSLKYSELICDQRENSNFRILCDENDSLKRQIESEKKDCIKYKIITTFIMASLRRKSLQLVECERRVMKKREECAARIVLHHLLLNSWRMTKAQVGATSLENLQMHKTIDNQSLQLNIIRKMQSMEKEKSGSILKDYGEVKRNYCQTMRENEVIKGEYVKVLEEKSALERHLKSLSDENIRLNTDLRLRLDKREMQLKSLELDRMQAERFVKEKERLARETELAKAQIRDLVSQSFQWQEKAMSLESKCFELKLEMERKEKALQRVFQEKQEITKENELLSLSKSNLEKAAEETQTKFVETTAQRQLLETSYSECKAELEDLEDQVEYLKTILRKYKRENLEIRERLAETTMRNVQRRRVWGAALYFLVNPFEAFKRFYYGTPERFRPQRLP